MVRQAFLSTRVVQPDGTYPAAIVVTNGKIESVLDFDQLSGEYEVHDFGDNCILPGLVDSHIHINEPGRAEWEGFETATRAAAAGGYTTLVDMPLNSLPGTSTVAALVAKRAAAEGKCRVDWAPWAGLVYDNLSELPALAASGVAGFKCFLVPPGVEGFTQVDEAHLRAAMPVIAKTGLPLLVHAELPGPIDEATETLIHSDWTQYATYLASRPDEAEVAAIRLLIELCRETRCRVHIVHLSSALALDLLREARAEALPITVETCPHYLHFAAEGIPDAATVFKCAPPIRSQANNDCLWEALLAGVIDLIASDHSPCLPEMKRRDTGSFGQAWGGISGIAAILPVVWTELHDRGLSLDHIAHWMAEAPAKLAGLSGQKGQISPGHDADLVVFDPEASFTLTPSLLYSRHPISPYVGETLRGVVKQTFLHGELVYNEGIFPGQPRGGELSR